MTEVVLKKAVEQELPKEFMTFVKRDMFNDSGFPHVVMPATKEALLSFVAHDMLKDNSPVFDCLKKFDIVVSQYDECLMVEIYYADKAQGHWVHWFIKGLAPTDVELPFRQSFDKPDVSLAEGWEMKLIKAVAPDDRGANPIHLWIKTGV